MACLIILAPIPAKFILEIPVLSAPRGIILPNTYSSMPFSLGLALLYEVHSILKMYEKSLLGDHKLQHHLQ
jgi:hypothetical protein